MILFLSYPFWPVPDLKAPADKLRLTTRLKNNRAGPYKFIRPNGTEQIRCDWVFDGNKEYVQQLAKHRLTFEDPEQLDTDCASIRARHYFPDKAASHEEANFGVARARIVYKVRMFIRTYSPCA